MNDIQIDPINETHVVIDCDDGILREISEKYTFKVPGAQFMPQFKTGRWDGKNQIDELSISNAP